MYEVTHKDGERWSTARAFLDTAEDRPNLTVITNALTNKVILENGRAHRVAYSVGKKSKTVHANREVILSGGAFGSPQLLLLSGVGATENLKPHGIETVHELPGVGENLQDHPDYVLSYNSPVKDNIGFSIGGGLRMIGEIATYVIKRTGMLSSNYARKRRLSLHRPQRTFSGYSIGFCPSDC